MQNIMNNRINSRREIIHFVSAWMHLNAYIQWFFFSEFALGNKKISSHTLKSQSQYWYEWVIRVICIRASTLLKMNLNASIKLNLKLFSLHHFWFQHFQLSTIYVYSITVLYFVYNDFNIFLLSSSLRKHRQPGDKKYFHRATFVSPSNTMFWKTPIHQNFDDIIRIGTWRYQAYCAVLIRSKIESQIRTCHTPTRTRFKNVYIYVDTGTFHKKKKNEFPAYGFTFQSLAWVLCLRGGDGVWCVFFSTRRYFTPRASESEKN